MLGEVLGLGADETDAYRVLVSVPATTPAELAARTGTAPDDAGRVLCALEQRGLAARSLGDPSRYVAVSPASIVRALLAERQNALDSAELELGELESIYRTSMASGGAEEVVDVVLGPDAIRDRFHQLQLGAREEVLSFVKAPVSLVSSAENTAERSAVARGVTYRALVERAMLDEDPHLLDEVVDALGRGEQVRTLDELPVKLIIVDREVAFLPLIGASQPASASPGALMVRQSGLLDALVALFEATWARGIPVVAEGGGTPASGPDTIDDLDARIVSLLLAGLSDQAVATQTQTSLRTVQRRIRHLMDLTGTKNRMQLGYHAARMGWA
jgi:sugar-specific transcriptional regulator TrmB